MYREPVSLTLHGVEFDRNWFIRDMLVFAGYGIGSCAVFIKNKAVAKKVAIAFMIQSAAMMFSKYWDDCTYEPTSLVIQGLALVGSIAYIYKNKPHDTSGRIV